MFAPESVFDKPVKRPRGFYHPSPYNKHEEPDHLTKTVSATAVQSNKNSILPSEVESKIGKMHPHGLIDNEVLDQENDSKVTIVYKENAATSVDDLIRDIDKDLEAGPAVNLPVASTKIDVGNILSVSDNSDTNVSVMSPQSLRYYMDRFKHSEPTHPSTRAKSLLPEQRQFFGKPPEVHETTSASDESNPDYSSILLNTASFLDAVVSSDDATTESFSSCISSLTSPVLESENSHMAEAIKKDSSGPKRQSSFIEGLTGKSFSELAALVPKTILNPSSESEDILYQWRLKRKIMEAHTTSESQFVSAIPYRIGGEKSINHQCKSVDKLPVKSSTTREMQTDAEKRETACQADIILPLKRCNLEHIQDDAAVVKCHITDDSCSEISISSASSGDLTNISQLDDVEITYYCAGKSDELQSSELNNIEKSIDGTGQKSTSSPETAPSKTDELVFEDHKTLRFGEACDEDINTSGITVTGDNLNTSDDKAHDSVGRDTSSDNSDELKFHLENIKDSFDDELLAIFIDKYKSVVDQIKVIEETINQKCNEL